jgi:peptidyl-prolyl cis-trans isomerase B (cyclophilin B)
MRSLSVIIFALLFIVFTPSVYAEYEDTIVVMETNSGKLIFEFFPDFAPNHVANFVKLSEEGVYTGTMFHRVIPGFMIQGGDPITKDPKYAMDEWGTGDAGYRIDAEFNKIKHDRGIVSMARSADPNSASSQFFIVHQNSHFLNGEYTVFGRILTDESFETLDKIAMLNTVNSDTGSNHQGGDVPNQPTSALITNVEILQRSDLVNLPKFVQPLQAEFEPMNTGGGKYTNTELGLSFNTPTGWFIQTPPRVDSSTPNIVVAGPKTGSISPTLTVTISMTTSNLKQNIEELKNQIKPLIDTDVISIQKETPFQSGSYNGHLIISTANFENTDNEILELGFATVLINENNRLYSLQYMNTLENYEEQIGYFHDMLTSFEIINTLSTESIQAQQIAMEEWKNDTSSEGGGCLIATAAFGSEMAPQVQFLREIRDNTVMTTQSGTTFMTGFNQFYYSFSPYVADYERENPVFKEAVKVTLTPLLTSLALLNYVDVDTEEEMLGYGIGIILLNIGMYFVAPAAVIIVIKNKLK